MDTVYWLFGPGLGIGFFLASGILSGVSLTKLTYTWFYDPKGRYYSRRAYIFVIASVAFLLVCWWGGVHGFVAESWERLGGWGYEPGSYYFLGLFPGFGLGAFLNGREQWRERLNPNNLRVEKRTFEWQLNNDIGGSAVLCYTVVFDHPNELPIDLARSVLDDGATGHITLSPVERMLILK